MSKDERRVENLINGNPESLLYEDIWLTLY